MGDNRPVKVTVAKPLVVDNVIGGLGYRCEPFICCLKVSGGLQGYQPSPIPSNSPASYSAHR